MRAGKVQLQAGSAHKHPCQLIYCKRRLKRTRSRFLHSFHSHRLHPRQLLLPFNRLLAIWGVRCLYLKRAPHQSHLVRCYAISSSFSDVRRKLASSGWSLLLPVWGLWNALHQNRQDVGQNCSWDHFAQNLCFVGHLLVQQDVSSASRLPQYAFLVLKPPAELCVQRFDDLLQVRSCSLPLIAFRRLLLANQPPLGHGMGMVRFLPLGPN
mmetsp:Transcript_66822/g.159461  ORF Transcript_66822/g.159461 Transcript_66822/m.159461 type:complete len:210 (+) Transcript_66822:967-1596(+)